MAYPKVFRCQHCSFSIRADASLKGIESPKYKMGEHYEKNHKHLIPEDMDGFRYFYYLLTKKERGACYICKSETRFNIATMKYCRFCDEPRCKEVYKQERDDRMIGKYGKVTLLKDPAHQKKMQNGRRISSVYTWSDGKSKFNCLSSYEVDFLKHLDHNLNWPAADIMGSPNIYLYHHNKQVCYYMPDFFIPSLSLEIEIKDDGSAHNINPDSRIREKKKDALLSTMDNHFDYMKISGKDYKEFEEYIRKGDNENVT